MRLPIPLTIQRKLTLIMLATCAVALIVAVTTLVVFDSINERQQILNRFEAQASFIVANSETNLVAHHVATDLPSGYTLPSTLKPNRDDTFGFTEIVQPIVLGPETVGYIYLLGDLTPL